MYSPAPTAALHARHPCGPCGRQPSRGLLLHLLPVPPCTQVRHGSAGVRTTTSQCGHSYTISGAAAPCWPLIFFSFIYLRAWVCQLCTWPSPLDPVAVPPCTQARHGSAGVRTTTSQCDHSCTISGAAAPCWPPSSTAECLVIG